MGGDVISNGCLCQTGWFGYVGECYSCGISGSVSKRMVPKKKKKRTHPRLRVLFMSEIKGQRVKVTQEHVKPSAYHGTETVHEKVRGRNETSDGS